MRIAVDTEQEVLAFTVYDYERDKKEVPRASDIEDLEVPDGSFANDILCDTLFYQIKSSNKAVKKTPSGV